MPASAGSDPQVGRLPGLPHAHVLSILLDSVILSHAPAGSRPPRCWPLAMPRAWRRPWDLPTPFEPDLLVDRTRHPQEQTFLYYVLWAGNCSPFSRVFLNSRQLSANFLNQWMPK